MATSNIRAVHTNLVERDEVFRLLAVAEACQLPVLLIGPPGTGKTAALIDYAKAYFRDGVMSDAQVGQKTLSETFILETDEGTRSGDVKGRLDMKKLLLDSEYHQISPIAHAKFVLINEVDKAGPSVRNSFLGVMNEKFLFNGHEKVKCQWSVFCAACNIIPSDEVNSPFWDRFVLKMDLKRISKGSMMNYYRNQTAKAPAKLVRMVIPTKEEMAAVRIGEDALSKFMEVCYGNLTDRTLSYVPRITAAITLIYKMPVNRALVKCAEILLDQAKGKELGNRLEPKEVIELRTKIELVMTLTDRTSLQTTLKDLENGMNALIRAGNVSPETIQDLQDEIALSVENNPLTKQNPAVSPFQTGTSSSSGSVAATSTAQLGSNYQHYPSNAAPSLSLAAHIAAAEANAV